MRSIMLYQPSRISLFIFVGLLSTSLAFISGCGSMNVKSTLTTKVGDRVVKATLDGTGSISSQNDTAKLNFKGGMLLVEKSIVTLDGEELTKIPEEAKKVEIDYL